MGRLVLLSGPACVGKGPLVQATRKFRSQLKFGEVGVIKSLESRPGGLRPTDDPRDFFAADSIRGWQGNPRYIVGDCRGLPQAVDLEKVQSELAQTGVLLIEAYYTLGRQVRDNASLAGIQGLETTSVFLSPLSQQEIDDVKTAGIDINVFLTGLMMTKILARARAMGKTIDDAMVRDAQGRATDALNELAVAHEFSSILVNRDGEGQPNWHYDYAAKAFAAEPEGDAGRALDSFAKILQPV